MSESKRIEYIDYLRGLSVTWVVWYHTVHPGFVDFPFRIPLFFFVSGIFFKAYSFEFFIKKKINQLVIPFIFFYAIYYLFLILLWGAKYHTLAGFDFSNIFDVFRLHADTKSFTVNPPLWFICSLINLQLLLYLLCRLVNRGWIILISSVIISAAALIFLKNVPLPFMIGRSLQYFVYYVGGYVTGKALIKYIEESNSNEYRVLAIALVSFAIFYLVNEYIADEMRYFKMANSYFMIFSVIISLLIFFKEFSHYGIFRPLLFFGVNSYIVLGMHEIYHTSILILIRNFLGEINVFWGIVQTALTLLILWPTIKIFNTYIPQFVAKKDFLSLPDKK